MQSTTTAYSELDALLSQARILIRRAEKQAAQARATAWFSIAWLAVSVVLTIFHVAFLWRVLGPMADAALRGRGL